MRPTSGGLNTHPTKGKAVRAPGFTEARPSVAAVLEQGLPRGHHPRAIPEAEPPSLMRLPDGESRNRGRYLTFRSRLGHKHAGRYPASPATAEYLKCGPAASHDPHSMMPSPLERRACIGSPKQEGGLVDVPKAHLPRTAEWRAHARRSRVLRGLLAP